jgi:glycine dehydrogenase subunit 1
VVKTPLPPPELNEKLLEYGIVGGYDLGQDYPALKNHLMFAVTEMNSREEIDYLVSTLVEVCHA